MPLSADCPSAEWRNNLHPLIKFTAISPEARLGGMVAARSRSKSPLVMEKPIPVKQIMRRRVMSSV